MALLKESVDSTLSFHAEMFPDTCEAMRIGDTKQFEPYRMFSIADRDAIKSKIREYETNHKSRSGGSELLKCLKHIETAKESLQKNIDTIREILQPKVVTRTTLAEATALAEHAAIRRVAATFISLPEKMLRSFAETVVGDAQIEYTVEELPVLIATKQISGIVLEPGKVQ